MFSTSDLRLGVQGVRILSVRCRGFLWFTGYPN